MSQYFVQVGKKRHWPIIGDNQFRFLFLIVITLAGFIELGKIPVVNDRLKISVRCFQILTWKGFIVLVGQLLCCYWWKN